MLAFKLALKERFVLTLNTYKKSIVATLVVSVLSACGGGDSNSEQNVEVANKAPTVAVSDTSVQEGASVTISAEASDSDGTIQSYQWSQKSGSAVTLNSTDSSTLTFVAPAVTDAQILVFTVKVTDNKGASASQDVKITITPKILELTLEGVVTDGTIANAKVVITVGDQAFAGVADNQGRYSIAVEVDDEYEDSLLNIIAVGPETDSKVKLISLLGDISTLLTTAGADGVLTADEALGVNVTHLSTALHALMKRANGDETITTKESFDNALKHQNGEELLPLATIIKLVIDYASTYPELALPDGFTDTDALVNDETKAREYLNKVQQKFPQVYEQAQAAVFEDPAAVTAAVAEDILASSYYFDDGQRLVLTADGKGQMFREFDSAALTWTVTEAGLALTYPGNGLLKHHYWDFKDGKQVQRQVFIKSTLIKWLYNQETSAQLLQQDTELTHYPNGEYADSTFIYPIQSFNAVKDLGLANAQALIEVGASYSISVPQTIVGIENATERQVGFHRKKVNLTIGENSQATLSLPLFSSDGSVHYEEVAGQYSVDDRGMLKVQATEESKDIALEYAFLNLLKPNKVNVVQENTQLVDHGYFLKKDVAGWEPNSVPGIYDYGWGNNNPQEFFWLELKADGTADVVKGKDKDTDGVLNFMEYTIDSGKWQINESGHLVIRRYMYNMETGRYGKCMPSTWDTLLTDDCVVFHDRVLNLYQVVGDRYLTEHTHKNYADFEGMSNLGDNLPVDTHVMDYAHSDNRSWIKSSERPIQLLPR